jgi:hypothetical protein
MNLKFSELYPRDSRGSLRRLGEEKSQLPEVPANSWPLPEAQIRCEVAIPSACDRTWSFKFLFSIFTFYRREKVSTSMPIADCRIN